MSIDNSIERHNRQKAAELLKTSTNPNLLAWAHMLLGIANEREHSWEAAVKSYSRGLNLMPTVPYTQYFCNNNLAFSLIQLGRFAEAEPYCHKAIEIERMRHNAYKNLGIVQEALGQLLAAASSYAAAAIVAPGDPRGLDLLKKLLAAHPDLPSQSEDLQSAIEHLEASVNSGTHAQLQ